jgi:hypothetical protein
MRKAFIAIFGTLFMQWPEKIRKATYTPIACCLVLSGCTIGQLFGYDQPLSIEEYQQRYSNFGDPLVGHQVEELIAERSQPDSVLEAEPKWSSFEHSVHVLSYIYYTDTAAGGSCIDAFVVVEDSGTIIKYYCR